MKKILTITLLVLLTVGLFVACNPDAVGALFGSQDSPFCFTALKAGSTVCLNSYVDSQPQNTEKLADVNFLYSTDNSTWADYTTGTSIILENENDKVYFKAKEKISGLNGHNVYYHFTGNGEVSVEGNIMYLLNPSGETVEMADHAFASLFKDNKALVSAKDLLLPATTLTPDCYLGMFSGCTNLTECPELKATVLAEHCYHSMFQECSLLTIAPELPATTLADYCYDSMFWKCKSLKTAPVLPANTLASDCYRYMFSECTSLTTAPVLPANTLVSMCYYNMFNGCTSLNSVTMLATDISATDCLKEWLINTNSTGTLKVANEEMKTILDNENYRPTSWTVSAK